MRVLCALAALAVAAAIDLDAGARVSADIEQLKEKLVESSMPGQQKEAAFDNLDQMSKDVDELQHITSPDRAANLEHAIRLRLSVLNQQLSDAQGMPNDRVSDDVESLKEAIVSSGLSLEQKETALANLEKIQRDCTEIATASPERKVELREALKLRLAALNHQLGASSVDLAGLTGADLVLLAPAMEESEQPEQEREPTTDELAAAVLSSILPALGDVQEIEIEIPVSDDEAAGQEQGEDAADEECERALRQIPPLLAGGLRCPVHHRPTVLPMPMRAPELVHDDTFMNTLPYLDSMIALGSPSPMMPGPFMERGPSPMFAPQLQYPFAVDLGPMDLSHGTDRTFPRPVFPDDLAGSLGAMPLPSAFSPVHLQTLAQLEPLHDQAVGKAMDMSAQPMVLKIEDKDGFNVISGWFPGVTKENMEVKLDGDTLRLNAAVTDKNDAGLDEARMFNVDLHDAKSIEEELDLPYAPPAQLFKAHFNNEKHTFVAVFPKQETVEVKLE